MDVFDTLDALEDQVRESPWIPFTRMRAVDLDLLEQLLRLARDQIERAQQEPLAENARAELLTQAENEGRLIVETARQEAQEILSDERISSQSRRYYDEIVGEGRQRANEHMRAAYAYTAERMTAIERSLGALRDQVSGGVDMAQKTTSEAEKNLRQRKKEASREKARARRQKIKEALF
jgi:vacuolar-type H+-ATPase subunit H